MLDYSNIIKILEDTARNCGTGYIQNVENENWSIVSLQKSCQRNFSNPTIDTPSPIPKKPSLSLNTYRLDSVPPEIFVSLIFKYLSYEDLCNAKLTCKNWSTYVEAFRNLKRKAGKESTLFVHLHVILRKCFLNSFQIMLPFLVPLF